MIAAKRSCSRSRIASSSRSRSRARSWRSSKSTADSRSFAAAYASAKPVKSSWRRSRSARGELVERGLLDRLARLLVAGAALAAAAQRAQVEQPLGAQLSLGQLEHLGGVRALELGRLGFVGEAAGGLAQLLHPLRQSRSLAQVEHEPAARRAERLVDADEHPAEPVRAVGREQLEPVGLLGRAEAGERRVERLTADDGALAVVELAEARVDSRSERVDSQQPVAEAVDRRDPGAVQLAREFGAAAARRAPRGSASGARPPPASCT